MPRLLHSHPFAVQAWFDTSVVLTYAVPKHHIEHLIPPCCTLDTLDDTWAFIAVAMVQTEDLRPLGFPKILGSDFFLIGYRVLVRYTNAAGRRLRGLYIMRTETDSRKMELLGNAMTSYVYSTTDVQHEKHSDLLKITSQKSRIRVVVDTSDTENVALPVGSPFTDWNAARRFQGPMPFTFSYHQASNEVLIVEGVRENWKPTPVRVNECSIGFIDALQLPELHLASATMVNDIPYRWKKGRRERWVP